MIIDDRYTLHEEIGRGGIGVVYRATDRLTGEIVALKRVLTQRRVSSEDSRMMMANEFRTLASMRHPHIISVLNYGFDDGQQPYFTMTYLPDADDMVTACYDLPLDKQIRHLSQLLQALAYLHQRGLLHYDLKPANVLVADGSVYALDFGLTIARGTVSDHIAGTVGYIAPEVINGEAATEAADLFSVGVMAYEMIAGFHPFREQFAPQTIYRVLNDEPDYSYIPPAVTPVLQQLLRKDPTDRLDDCGAAITVLCQAIEQRPPRETTAIRESYLQAAAFVGREREMDLLNSALSDAMLGRGSVWLIGGESGVGKTRLVDELRTLALVRGVRVLRGQGTSEGGTPYEYWRNPIRYLSLAGQISNTEAGILKAIIPDIADLMGHPLADPPPLSGDAARRRLLLAITGMFRRLRRPTLLILEDLQWAVESLDPLISLTSEANAYPLMVVGTYRDDDMPDLPVRVPGAQGMTLPRLSERSIVLLSKAMLGEADPEVVGVLARETEGNAFFLVEMVRTLAEEAGSRGAIRAETLPERILAEGVEAIVQERLARVPDWGRDLLEVAAVVGRHIDTDIMGLFTDDLDRWLTTCANLAILDVEGDLWRFSHDKLREGVLREVEGDLYCEVAEAIEDHVADRRPYAARLTMMWQQAGDQVREREYAVMTGELLMEVSAYDEAIRFLERAVDLFSPAEHTAAYDTALKLLGDAYAYLSDYEQAVTYYEQSLALARELDDHVGMAAALNGIGEAGWRQGRYAVADICLTRALTLAVQAGDQREMARALGGLGDVAWLRGQYEHAESYYQESLGICEEIGDQGMQCVRYGDLGNVAEEQGHVDEAQYYCEQSLAIAQEIGNRRVVGVCYGNLGRIAFIRGELEAAREHSLHALDVLREIGDRWNIIRFVLNAGLAADLVADYIRAEQHIEEGLGLAREIGDRRGIVTGLIYLAILCLKQEQPLTARHHITEALHMAREIGAISQIITALVGYAWLLLHQGDVEQATHLAGLADAHAHAFHRATSVEPLLAELDFVLSPDERIPLMAEGTALDPREVVRSALRALD